jgi:hypothetical protein
LEAARQQHVPGRLDIFGDQEEYDNLENKILKEMGVVTGRNIARDVVKEAVDKEQTEQQAVDAALKQAGEKSKNPIFLNAVEDQTRNRFSSAHTALHNARSEQVTKGLDELAKLENTIKTDKDGKPIVPSNIFDDASRIEDKYGLHEVTNKAQELQRTARQLQLPEPLARESNLAAMDLFRRMNLPTDDPNKITSLSQVRDVYAPPDGSPGKLTRADEEWLEKRFIEAGTPDGERLSKIRAQFSKAVEPMIDKSNPLLGKIDQSGKLQNYAFERFVDQKMDEYRKAGKNPSDLLDPSKPDYLGSPEVLKPYLIPLQESLRTMTERLTGASARGIAPPSPQPTVPQRKPGESMADFDKRIGIK